MTTGNQGSAQVTPRGSERPDARAVREQVELILLSADFDASRRSREFLLFVVDEALAGRGEALTQAAIATRAFGRNDDFNAEIDPIVRIHAGRLRRSLERYYLLSGKRDPVRIDLRKGTYVPTWRWATASEGVTATPMQQSAVADQVDDWPSVVLRLFESVGQDPELDERAVGLREELAAELGRYGDVRVLLGREQDRPGPAGPGGARFELAGRVRGSDAGVVLTARLADGVTGRQIWEDKYRIVPGSVSASPSTDDVARLIAAQIGSELGVIAQLLMAEHRKRPLAEPTPYDAVLSSYHFFFMRDPDAFRPAVEALRRVVATEPQCGLAWTQLARLYTMNFANEVTAIDTPIDQAIGHAQTGVHLNPASTRARCVLAMVLLVKGELAAGRQQLERTLDLNPGSLVYLEVIGWLLTLLGDGERGPAVAREAVARNPRYMPVVANAFWVDHLRRGQYEEAYQATLDYRDHGFFWRALMQATCLGHLGRTSEASEAVAELLQRKPDFPSRGRILIGRFIKFPDLMERVVDGLAKAGLPLG